MIVLQTERLILRHMLPGDAEALFAVLGDPLAMQYYPAPFSREEVAAWIARYIRSYRENGYGLYAMVLKQTNEVLGDCGHTRWEIDGQTEIEIGYHVRRDFWRQGYATEAARACVDHGFSTLRAGRLIAFIRPENLPSRRVAEKIGMRIEREMQRKGLLHFVYSLAKPA